MAEDIRETITKLGQNNYYAWSCQVEALLDSKDLWVAIEDGYLEAELEDCNPRELRDNKRALAFLKRSVEDHHLETIGHLKSAKEAWDALKSIFVVRDELQQLMMMKEFMRMEKGKDQKVGDFINKVTAAHRELCESDLIAFNDRTVALIILMGLPEEFKDCVRSLARDPNLSIRKVRSILQAEETKIKIENEDNSVKTELKGYMSKNFTPANSSSSSSLRTIPECFACHKKGHVAKNCYKVLNAKGRGNVICYSCGQEGHPSSMCQKNSGGVNNGGANSASTSQSGANSASNVNKNSGGDSKKGQNKFKSNEAKIETQGVRLGAGVVKVKYTSLMGRHQDSALAEGVDPNKWCLDSGCNAHTTPFRELLENFKPVSGTMSVAKKDQCCDVKGVGSVKMKVNDRFGGWVIELKEVYWVPDSPDNLISVRQLDKKGIKSVVDSGWFYAYDKNNNEEELFRAEVLEGEDLYAIYVDWYEKQESVQEKSSVDQEMCSDFSDISLTARRALTKEIWHQRFAHANNLPDHDIIPKGECEDCSVCHQGKAKTLPFSAREKKSEELLDLVYSDVCFVQPVSKTGGVCFITFTDDYSRFSEVCILKSKAEAFNAFVDFKARTENFHQKSIKQFQTDNGKEYVNSNFKQLLKSSGIVHRLSMSGAHQQMGVSERLNQTLLTMARCMLIQSGLAENFWGEAVSTACFIRNRCKTKILDNGVPYELWFKKPLSKRELQKMAVFGCQAWVLVENSVKSHKMEPKSIECVMLGYPKDKSGYRLWDIKKGCVVLSRNVRFCETIFPMKKGIVELTNDVQKCDVHEVTIGCLGDSTDTEESGESESEEERGSEDEGHVSLHSENSDSEHESEGENNNVEVPVIPVVPVLRRSERIRQRKECLQCKSVKLSSCDFCDPKTVDEAMSSENKNEWIKAMEDEISNHSSNHTWDLVKKPDHAKITGCRWVFKTLRDQSGNIVRFKARLVAQGFNQVPGVDYSETYSPVVNRKVIRLMTALMVENDWTCVHVDVKCAYLNSPIKEEIYIQQPEGFVSSIFSNFVCKLNKSMYGLKQAGKDWHDYLDNILRELGLKRSVSDCCLYVHTSKALFISVYVDDLGVWGIRDLVDTFVNLLSNKVNIRNLGFPSNFLNVKFERKVNGVCMNQSSYVGSVLLENGLEDCKGVTTILPVPPKDESKPNFTSSEMCNKTEFRSVVGSIRHVAIISRPDINYAVCKLSQQFENPTLKDLKEARHLLRYLKHTKEKSLMYVKTGKPVVVYVDASWGNRENGGKSITGYVIILAGASVIWKSVTQKRVAANNNEAEVLAMVDVLKELRWLEVFLADVGMSKFLSKPCIVFSDNQGGILISKGEGVSDRTRHCAVESFLLQESVRENFVVFEYKNTKENVADVLTKVLSGVITANFCEKLGLY